MAVALPGLSFALAENPEARAPRLSAALPPALSKCTKKRTLRLRNDAERQATAQLQTERVVCLLAHSLRGQFDRCDQRFGFIQRFFVFGFGVAVGDDSTTGLHVHDTILDDHCA